MKDEALRLALEALKHGGCPPDCKDGMTDSGGVHPWGEAALIPCPNCKAITAIKKALEQPEPEPVITRLDGMRKAIYDLDCALWRARAEAAREGNYHTQLGHAIDALGRLQVAFGIATPQPDTNGTRSWFTVDELNAWADKYEAKLKEKNT